MLKNERGFTLIEMLIVLMIISVLIILIIPNISKQTDEVNNKGCEALVSVVKAQTQAYYLEKDRYPSTIKDLTTAKLLDEEQTTCPNGKKINVKNGQVSVSDNDN